MKIQSSGLTPVPLNENVQDESLWIYVYTAFLPGDSYNCASLGHAELQSSKDYCQDWENKALFFLLLSFIKRLCDWMLAVLCTLWLNEINIIVSILQRKTDFQRRKVTCSRSHSWGMTEPGWHQSLDSRHSLFSWKFRSCFSFPSKEISPSSQLIEF